MWSGVWSGLSGETEADWVILSSVFSQFHVERERQQVGEGHDALPVRGGEDDGSVGKNELRQNLPAGSAWRACRVVEIGNSDGGNSNLGAKLRHCSDQRRTFGANGEPVANVLHICAGHNRPVGQLQSGADSEVRIGRIGVLCSLDRLGVQVVERRMVFIRYSQWVPSAHWVKFEATAFPPSMYRPHNHRSRDAGFPLPVKMFTPQVEPPPSDKETERSLCRGFPSAIGQKSGCNGDG